jgi:hypothetical protein
MMEIPLTLRARKDGSLVYAIPAAYRAAMAVIVALLAAALFMDGRDPGIGGWAALGLAALGALYEESWTFDRGSGRAAHRVGLLFLARRTAVAIGDLRRFRIAPFVRGTVPGSADEARENAAALAEGRAASGGYDAMKRRSRFKKPYLCLVLETVDGSRRFVNAVPARRGAALRAQAARIAEACGLPLVEGEGD